MNKGTGSSQKNTDDSLISEEIPNSFLVKGIQMRPYGGDITAGTAGTAGTGRGEGEAPTPRGAQQLWRQLGGARVFGPAPALESTRPTHIPSP